MISGGNDVTVYFIVQKFFDVDASIVKVDLKNQCNCNLLNFWYHQCTLRFVSRIKEISFKLYIKDGVFIETHTLSMWFCFVLKFSLLIIKLTKLLNTGRIKGYYTV